MNDLPRRKHIRIPGYDYRTPGPYFVTICLQQRSSLLATIDEGEVRLTDKGTLIRDIWIACPSRYSCIELDEYIIMPDHIHGILSLVSSTFEVASVSFISVIQWFKSYSTNEYIKRVKTEGWPRFDKHLWQPDYYERAIRNERDLEKFRNYIRDNPFRWEDKCKMHGKGVQR